ncbi:polycystin-1-like protein 2 [Clarias gariepinus]
MNISLQSDPTNLTEIEWFYVKPEQFSIQPKGSVVVSPCKKNKNGQMHLSHLGSGTFYNVSSVLLKTLSPGSTIVVKGYKNQDLGYGCYNIQLPTFRNPRPKRASIVNLPSTTCTISPSTGDIFTLFNISCISCPIQNCRIFLITSTGDYVNIGYQVTTNNNLFLPQGSIQLSLTNLLDQEYGTTLPNQVTVSTNVSVGAVKDVVSKAVSLQKSGAISTDMLALLFKTISDNMNSSYSQNDKEMLVESMSTSLCKAMSQGNTVNLLNGIKVISSSVLSLVMHENELTPNAKAAVCCVLDQISKIQISPLKVMGNVTATTATLPVVLAASILLNLSAANDQQTSESLLRILNQVQGTMLANKPINTEPIVLSSPLINLYVNRLTWDKLNQFQISTGSNSVIFSLPSSVSYWFNSNDPVNLRMMNIGLNPYAWNNDEIISGTIGGLSLTKDDGSVIQLRNLPDEIEILFPSVSATASNRTFLNLTTGNGTMPIYVTARRTSLVVKLEPSDSTPLMMYLGFNYYPNNIRHLAKIQLPQTSNSQGDGYTWVITPYQMYLGVGIYYLLVVPIVPAGGQSPASVLITALTTNCNYWNDHDKGWKDDGCRVGPLTTTLVTQCLCNHLTTFGTSLSVIHDTVGVSHTAHLFPTFLNNLLVMGIFGAIFLGCIITVMWAHKKDIEDKTKVEWLKQQKSKYFRKYNLLEMAIILSSLAALGAIINGTIQGDKDLKYFQEHRNLFSGFLDAASADTYMGYILAFLILLGTIKMCHMIHLNSKQKLISCTLYQKWMNTSSVVLVFSVVALVTMVVAYSIVTSEEEEIVDLLIIKICNMLGIPVKKK